MTGRVIGAGMTNGLPGIGLTHPQVGLPGLPGLTGLPHPGLGLNGAGLVVILVILFLITTILTSSLLICCLKTLIFSMMVFL